MYWKALDKVDTSIYKGLAILMIATHNFMHLFPLPKENEFEFNPDRFFNLLTLVINEPENILRALLSFFGHFGVQIFIFLSAYGLTKKYFHCKVNYWPFIFGRILKIYPAFILAILAWAIIISGTDYGLLGPLKMLYWNIKSLALKLTLLSNFIPSESLWPVGPWWFISFIFQFYIVFPYLLFLHSRWGNGILLLVSILSILLSALVQGYIAGINVYFTILGHLPEFCLGIYLAKRDSNIFRVPVFIVYTAFVIYILGNIYELFWYVNHISFLILLLALYSCLTGKIKNNVISRKFFLFFGAISMHLFLVNGFLREPFILWAKDHDHWLLTIVLCLLSLLVSVMVAWVLSKIEKHMMLKANVNNIIMLAGKVRYVLSGVFTRMK